FRSTTTPSPSRCRDSSIRPAAAPRASPWPAACRPERSSRARLPSAASSARRGPRGGEPRLAHPPPLRVGWYPRNSRMLQTGYRFLLLVGLGAGFALVACDNDETTVDDGAGGDTTTTSTTGMSTASTTTSTTTG